MAYVAPTDRYDAFPEAPSGTAVLLLAGSSSRIERSRADLFARHGARVRAIRWFGGIGQRPAPHEVPVEAFIDELENLRPDADRVAVFGTSFGAEAALVTASLHRVDAVVAVAPSSVVWSGVVDGSWSSHWSHHGNPLPAVPFAQDWEPDADPPAFRSLYATSLTQAGEQARTARIRSERIDGEVLLIAGGDDQVWPATDFAADIVAARNAAGLATCVVTHPQAGHRLLLPGEAPAVGGVTMARGGTPEADAALGAKAWPEIVRVLGLHTDPQAS